MGHIRQEITLRLVRRFRCLESCLCRLHRFFQLLVHDSHFLSILLCCRQLLFLLSSQQPYDDHGAERRHEHSKHHYHVHGSIHQFYRIQRHSTGAHEKYQRPLGILHAVHGIVIFFPVEHGIGICRAGLFQFLSCNIKRGIVKIFHAFQYIIDIIAFDQRSVLTGKKLQTIPVYHVDSGIALISRTIKIRLQFIHIPGNSVIDNLRSVLHAYRCIQHL